MEICFLDSRGKRNLKLTKMIRKGALFVTFFFIERIALYIYIYIFKPLKSEAIHETGLSGNVVASLFPSHNIYSALLQGIEHCSTRKSTCRLPIYIHIYIYIYLVGFQHFRELSVGQIIIFFLCLLI